MNSTSPLDRSRPAVVLVSGGLDSATALAIALDEGFVCHALTFDYGQRHRVELEAARLVARAQGVASHRWITIDLRAFGQSSLTDQIDVPKDRDEAQMASGIPLTYVPARNTIFLSYALACAEVTGSRDVFIGVNAVDYSGYPDCRPQYIQAFEAMGNLATRAAVEGASLTIHAPLIQWPKTRIIQRGLELGVDFGLTHTCYDPKPDASRSLLGVRPCGRCDACVIRRRAFEDLGQSDPALA